MAAEHMEIPSPSMKPKGIQLLSPISSPSMKPKGPADDKVGGGLLTTLRVLRDVYGWKLLGMLSFSMWIIKGVVWGLSLSAVDFLLRDYGISGPQMQVYKGIIMLPWAMKPIFGLLSDALPLRGYRKAPYMTMATIAAVVSYAVIGFSPAGSIPIRMVIAGLIVGCTQVAIVDLLSEAAYAERIREHPKHGPDLISYVWGGITLGALVATAMSGFIIEHLGAHYVYAFVVIPAALVLIPTCLNWLEEKPLHREDTARIRARLWEQREVMFLVMVIGLATVVLVGIGLLQSSVWVNLAVAVLVAVVVVVAFTTLLSPIIGKVNCFFFIQTCCVIDISGATFYFFTDDSTQYPEGPHFSQVFFASGLGVFVSLLNLLGMGIYNRHMKEWRYHGLFVFANLLVCVTSFLNILVFARVNVVIGIPDHFFVMGTFGVWAIVHMWMWIPGVVLMSQLCPEGVEATMYALLAGCHNLGLSTSSYIGAAVLTALKIQPQGAPGETHAFDNLWIAALIQAVAPTLTLFLLPWMIPNASQTERLLQRGESAVSGSPWKRFRGACASTANQPLSSEYGATSCERA